MRYFLRYLDTDIHTEIQKVLFYDIEIMSYRHNIIYERMSYRQQSDLLLECDEPLPGHSLVFVDKSSQCQVQTHVPHTVLTGGTCCQCLVWGEIYW